MAIHTGLLYAIFPYEIAFFVEKLILRLAVPFFFVASGYFLRCKIKDDYSNAVEQVLTYCKKLLKPYIVFLLIAITIQTILYYKQGGSNLSALLIIIIKSIVFYPQGALWFVWACMIGSLLLIPFLLKNKINIALIVGFILYIIMLLFNSYSFVLVSLGYQENINNILNMIISLRNGLHVGFFMIVVGMKCYEIGKKIKIDFKTILIGGGLLIAYAIEILFVYKMNNYSPSVDDNAYFLIQIPLVATIFLSASSVTSNKNNTLFIRQLSVFTYFLHSPIRDVIAILSISLGSKQQFILCVICSCIIYCIYICLIKHRKNLRK